MLFRSNVDYFLNRLCKMTASLFPPKPMKCSSRHSPRPHHRPEHLGVGLTPGRGRAAGHGHRGQAGFTGADPSGDHALPLRAEALRQGRDGGLHQGMIAHEPDMTNGVIFADHAVCWVHQTAARKPLFGTH